jgi:predicted RNase H-like nuclease (RuvC/YqgF family)
MTRREWVAPGILITLVTLGANFVSDWAVERYRGNAVEISLDELKADLKRQNESTNRRIDGIDTRLQEMAKGASDTARLQEANRNLEARIAELDRDLREIEGRGQARYENLSTRLARAESKGGY